MNSVPSRNNTIGYCDSDDEDDYHDTVLLVHQSYNSGKYYSVVN